MKALIWLVVIVLLSCGGAYIYLNLQQGPDEKPYVVEKKIIRRAVHGSGLVEGSSVVLHLKFPFSGILDDLDAKEWQSVKQNDILAKLNTVEVDSRIKLEEAGLKEANAKRAALKARKAADQVANAEFAVKSEQATVREWEAKVNSLKTPAAAASRQEQIENAAHAFERAQQAQALAEAEMKQLKSHPTPDELAVSGARLEAAKLRGSSGPGAESAAAELRYALADYDKTKRGATAEDLAAAQARIDLAKAELRRASDEKLRLEKPQPPPSLPLAEIAAAEKTLADAQARLNGKREELDRLRKDVETAELLAADAAVEGATERLKMLKTMKLGYELRAPFDALIVKRLTEPGALLSPNEDVLWIVDFTRKRVRAEFDVMALPALLKTPTLTASIKSRAFGKEELTASVLDIGKTGPRRLLLEDPSQPKGGEVVEVLLEIEKPTDPEKKLIYEKLLRPGLRAEADIALEASPTAVICVPNSYVSSEKGVQYVWKTELNQKTGKLEKPRKKEVKCGMRDDYYVEIKDDDLHAEDLLVKPKSLLK